MLRFLLLLAICAVLAYCGSTVKLGERTFFDHVRAVWSTDEAKDMRKGLEEKTGPALDRMKRGVKAGIEAAAGEDGQPVPAADGGPWLDAGPLPDASPLPADAAPAEAPLPPKDPKAKAKPKADR